MNISSVFEFIVKQVVHNYLFDPSFSNSESDMKNIKSDIETAVKVLIKNDNIKIDLLNNSYGICGKIEVNFPAGVVVSYTRVEYNDFD